MDMPPVPGMTIPGEIIAALTFPGVIVHEAAHHLFCRLFNVPVYEVQYFRFNQNPAGYVAHEACDRPAANIFISVGPFIINTIVGSLIVLSPAVEFFSFWDMTSPIAYVMTWLGVSILMHAFPSRGDARSLFQSVVKNKDVNIAAKIIALPIVGLINAGAFGAMFGLDLFYGIGLSFLLPKLLAGLLM